MTTKIPGKIEQSMQNKIKRERERENKQKQKNYRQLFVEFVLIDKHYSILGKTIFSFNNITKFFTIFLIILNEETDFSSIFLERMKMQKF